MSVISWPSFSPLITTASVTFALTGANAPPRHNWPAAVWARVSEPVAESMSALTLSLVPEALSLIVWLPLPLSPVNPFGAQCRH